MQQYEKKVIHALLDTYERSLLSRGENKVTVHIAFPFTKKTIPQYFDESSLAYEEIHAAMRQLEQKDYVSIVWKRGKENHIIQKILLNDRRVSEVYQYAERVPKSELNILHLQKLKELEEKYQTPIAAAFISWMSERIQLGKSVREFIEISDTGRTEQIVRAIAAIERNKSACYIREFSIQQFGDTKILEGLLGVINKIMHRFDVRYIGMDIYAILAEYGIYHTPNYVYFKGTGTLSVGSDLQSSIDLWSLHQGIGLSGDDLDDLRFTDVSHVKQIITIENLTTFFRWMEPDSILIYLGGYHNSVRRKLLQMLHEQIPEAVFLHFGDIDVGGFEIYEDLCEKTGIKFKRYRMGIAELKRYEKYTKRLTENDKLRLDDLMIKATHKKVEYADVLQYMKDQGIKLEQECIKNEP